MRVRLFVLCAVFALCACAKQPSLPEVTSEQATATWNLFTARSVALEPYRLSMSLRYGLPDDTRRVTALLWSNGSGPVRLDVMAGMGPLVARVREDGPNFVAVSPRDNKAWVYENTDPYSTTPRVLINLGVPLPFSLTHMAALLQGNFVEVFGVDFLGTPESLPADQTGGIRYNLSGPVTGTLDLSSAGLPQRWADSTGAWVMDLGYSESEPNLPQRLTLTHSDGNMAIVLVKNREYPAQPFAEKQLLLDIPANAHIQPIQRKN